MSRLTSKGRNALPGSSFGLPGSRKYPMPDKAHAANAKARASQQAGRGNLSKAGEAKVDAKANRILGVTKGSVPMKKSLPAALKAHEFKKGGGGTVPASTDRGDLAKGKPAAKAHAKAPANGSHLDHVVSKYRGGYNPGRGK